MSVGAYDIGPYHISLNASLSVTDTRRSTLLWSTLGTEFIQTAVSHLQIGNERPPPESASCGALCLRLRRLAEFPARPTMQVSHDSVVGASGCWYIKRDDKSVCVSSGVSSARLSQDGSLTLTGAFAKPCKQLGWTLAFYLADADATALGFSLALNRSDATSAYDRVSLLYSRADGERYFGFGQQYTYLDAAGSLVPIFAREGGIGRGLEPITAALNAFRRECGGDERTTYSATPHYVTSHLRSLHLTSTEPAEFDLRTSGAVRVEVSATTMHGRMLTATSPLALLSAATAFMGRMKPLPAWR